MITLFSEPANAYFFLLLGSILVPYLLGSMPTAYIVGRFYGKDIREIGSGNVGATNALRAFGKGWGSFVLLIDVLKGYFAILISDLISKKVMISAFHKGILGDLIVQDSFYLALVGAFFAVTGHIYPVWLSFRGGRGIATLLGVMLGIDPYLVIMSFTVFLITASISNYMSLSSVLGSASSLIFFFTLYELPKNVNLFIFFLLVSILVIYKHIPNMRRILEKKEPKITYFLKK